MVGFRYPADLTFVCPTELGDLADHDEEFKKICCEICSVSADTHFVHKVWPDVSDTVKKIRYSFADPTARAGFRGLRREEVAVINPEAKLVP